MRTTIFASVLGLAVVTAAQYLNQTAPFALVVLSRNHTLNGTSLAACHEGAAIEGLCIGPKFSQTVPTSVDTFTFNYSASATVEPSIGCVGWLTYELRGSNFMLSSPMQFSYNPTSNVAVPLLTPSESGQTIAFREKDNLMAVPGYIDDTVTPPAYHMVNYYRWHICDTNAGYNYVTAAWVLGDKPPQNPSCQKVDILRVFV